ncbi:Ohr family peroxiredoxin [Moraxella lincolnii]|uniref:Osmotically inducible protein OsmC n=1 Tax=Lwoffella lincolnii TaxID=90241 RepID=A0A1T0CF43_9GAMM|nr:Ohr family peroxiredoxin [Moraxella lincolnii]OOS20970.1 osmotically inducible protein OsmC [Moraxella lincolnii]
MKSLYSTQATVTGGRTGKATLSDSDLSINMVSPGSGQDGNNPEQLFAVGYAACFDGALSVVKKSQNVNFASTTQITVELLQGDEHDYQLAAKIHVIAKDTELSSDDVQKLVEKAHEVCPYSKATRGNIKVEVTSEVQ